MSELHRSSSHALVRGPTPVQINHPTQPLITNTDISEVRVETDEELNVKNFTGKLSNYLIGEDYDESDRPITAEGPEDGQAQSGLAVAVPLPPTSLKPATGELTYNLNLASNLENLELNQYQRSIRNVALRHFPHDL